jgi:ribosome-associated translation inhibitor RaiA
MSEITLSGFDSLDPAEVQRIEEIIDKRLKKLKVEYKLFKISLKEHKHSKRIAIEVNADLFLSKGKSIFAQSTEDNLYKALDQLMEKINSEISHKFKK